MLRVHLPCIIVYKQGRRRMEMMMTRKNKKKKNKRTNTKNTYLITKE